MLIRVSLVFCFEVYATLERQGHYLDALPYFHMDVQEGWIRGNYIKAVWVCQSEGEAAVVLSA